MAVIWFDGMAHASGNVLKYKYERISTGAGGLNENNSWGRFNSHCYFFYNIAGEHKIGKDFGLVSQVVLGLGLNKQANSGGAGRFLQVGNQSGGSSAIQVAVQWNTTQTYSLLVGASEVASTGSTFQTTSDYDFLELVVHWHASTGSATLYVSDIAVASYTGNTTNGGSGFEWADIRVPANGAVANFYDDFYIADDQGSGLTQRIGSACRIYTITPGSEVSTQWQASGNYITPNTNWRRVADLNTDNWAYAYNQTSTIGDYDLFQASGDVTSTWASNTTSIYGVQVNGTLYATSAFSVMLTAVLSSVSAVGPSAVAYLSAWAPKHHFVLSTTPNGDIWSLGMVSAIQWGIQVT